MAAHDLGAGDEGCDLLLLADLPVDIFLDVGMVDVDHDHLGGAARRAARLDGAGRAVADLEERHQARRLAAARQLLTLAAQVREVGARARTVFEQARLADPQIHDAALVDEVVGHALDEAGMRLRMLVGRLRLGQLAGEGIDVIVALAGAVDAVGPMQPGIEPLRRIGRDALGGEHVAELVHEGAGVVLAVEIAALPAPVGPGAGKPVEDLARVGLGAVALVFRQFGKGGLVGHRTPQEGGDGILLDLLQAGGHAGLAEIFLGENVARDLAELHRYVDVVEPEDDRAVRVLDLGKRLAEFDVRIGRPALLGVMTFDAHALVPKPLNVAPFHSHSSQNDVSGAVPHSIPVGPADRRPQNPVSALRRDRFSERGHVATLRRKAGVVSTRWVIPSPKVSHRI